MHPQSPPGPPVPAFGAPEASGWSRGSLPWWVPSVALVAAWVLAFAAATAGDTERCSAADPSVCGPDVGFAVAAVALFATPVLLWWIPLAGCLTGALFGVLDVLEDEVTAARWSFGVHAALCVLAGLSLLADNRQRRRVASAAAGPARATLPPGADPGGLGPRSLAAVAVALAGLGLVGWYVHADRAEQAHLDRAVRVEGRVTALVDDGYGVRLRLPDGTETDVGVLDPYRVGDRMPVLRDPADPGWTRLVAEPADPTGWLTGGLSALLLAAVLAWRDESARRARRRLATAGGPALRVRARVDGDDVELFVGARSGHRERVLARFPAFAVPTVAGRGGGEHADPDDAAAEFGAAWRAEPGDRPRDEFAPFEEPAGEPVVVLGDLWLGGYVAAVGDEVTWLPLAPLRPVRRFPHRLASVLRFGDRELAESGGPGEANDHVALPGRPVPAASRPPDDLPWVLRPPAGDRRLGAIGLLALLAGAPVALWSLGRPSLITSLLFATCGASLVAASWTLLTHSATLDHAELRLVGAWWEYRFPWRQVDGARLAGEDVVVGWAPENLTPIGRYATRTGEEVAAAVGALRELALREPGGGGAVTRRPRLSTVSVVAVFLALTALAWWSAPQA